MEVLLSEDVAAAYPAGFETRWKVLRSHEEEIRTGFLGLRRKTVKVIDDLRMVGLTVHQVNGETWDIPLGYNAPEEEVEVGESS